MPVLSASTSLVAMSPGVAEVWPAIGAIYEGRPWAFATPPAQDTIARIIPQKTRFILASPWHLARGISGCSKVFVKDHPAGLPGNWHDAHSLIGVFLPKRAILHSRNFRSHVRST